MVEYLERESILNAIRKTSNLYVDQQGLYLSCELITAMPASDVQPVKHGRWIGEEVIQCSNCNFTLNGTSYGRIVHKYFSYCPKCGANMRGDTE